MAAGLGMNYLLGWPVFWVLKPADCSWEMGVFFKSQHSEQYMNTRLTGVFPRHLMAEFGGISEMEKISWRMSSSKKEAFFHSGGYLVVLIKRADL